MSRIIPKAPKIEYTPFHTSVRNIDGLKPPGTIIRYTPEMLQEYYKCANDPLYFISNYYYIIDLDKGLTQISLWDFQYDFIDHIHDNRFSLVLASRQVGKSIISIGYILWYIVFHNDKYVAVLSKSAQAASEIMAKLKKSFLNLPQWLMPNVETWAGTTIQLDNGSFISSHSTTENAGRSASANILFLDEFAFVPQNIAQKFYTSAYPIISNSLYSKVIICSTPNGYNHFYVMQDKAQKAENEYKLFTIYWNQVPGRDEKWKKQTIANLSMEAGVDGAKMFDQEYDLNFENSDRKTIISGGIQKKIANEISKQKHIYLPGFESLDKLYVWEKPKMINDDTPYIYILSADVSEGVGGDYSTFSIFKIDTDSYDQIAVFRDNNINPIAFAELIHRISKVYNNAYIIVENNGPGQSTCDHLWHNLENETMIHSQTKGIGFKTNKRSRDKGIIMMKEYLDSGTLKIRDIQTLNELSRFIKYKNKFQAEKGYHDDMVMTLVIFCKYTKDIEFQSLFDGSYSNDDIKKKMNENLVQNNPYIIDYSKIYDNEEAITIVSNADLFY